MVIFSKEAVKDTSKLTSKLKEKLKNIITNQIIKDHLFGKKLTGDLTGFFFIRLSYKDRIIYSIY